MSLIRYPSLRRRTAPAHPDRGQVLVLFVLAVVALIGAAALTVDYGYWLLVRRDYQNVADGAALSGARFLTRPLSDPCNATGTKTKPACAREAAWAFIEQRLGVSLDEVALSANNLVDQPVGDYRITVSTPATGAGARYPGSAPGAATMFAYIERDNPTYLSRIFGIDRRAISAWATAGSRSGRFAVITLRKIGDDGPNDTKDIDIAGTNTSLVVKNGDVGGNWGLAISGSGATLRFLSDTSDAYGAFLSDPSQSAPTCCSWTPGQVINGTVEYLAEVPDPEYPLPQGVTTATLGTPGPSSIVPTTYPGGVVDVRSSGPAAGQAPGGSEIVAGKRICRADSPRIGPGYYTSISLEQDTCLILDPTVRHTSVSVGTPDVPTAVPQTQAPGVFYVAGTITVGNGAMLVGDGVTLVIRPGNNNAGAANKLDIKANAVVAVNTGATPGGTPQTLGAWYWNTENQAALSPYAWGTAGPWTYNTSLQTDLNNRGIAVYVPKRSQYTTVAVDDNSSVLNNIESSAAMVWKGVIYAPHDNVTYAGQVGYDAVGQLVAWTIKFTGGTTVTQDYTGPEQGIPYLIEPRLGQ